MMGSSIGAAARTGGATVAWCADGRSAATRRRAEGDGLRETATLAQLVGSSDIIVSICPPDAAEALAIAVVDKGFQGIFVDANAVNPESARRIAALVTAPGGHFVDGGIVGPPARGPGSTVLYLSGERSCEVAALFDGSLLQTHVLGERPGDASAVKMAFAAWTKGSSALLLAVRALAEKEGVTDGLLHAWDKFAPELAARSEGTAAGVGPKAWRFEGEMRESAAGFDAVGLPAGFHEAAAEVYRRLATFKDADAAPSLQDVIAALTRDH